MRFRAVLFDVGDTLVGPRVSFGETYARVLAPLGLERSGKSFEKALRQQWSEMSRTIPAGTDRYSHFPGGECAYWLQFVSGALARITDRSLPEDFPRRVLDALREAFRDPDAWEIFDDVVPTLEILREAGIRLGIVSNWDTRLPDVLERLDLVRFFDTVTVSSLEGIEKPDPRIFRRALQALGAEADTTMHVGDLPETDLAGAKAAGLVGILVDRKGRLDPSLNAIPDLLPLPGLVKQAT